MTEQVIAKPRNFATEPAELYVTDRFGKKVYPKEWFYVLPDHVGRAAKLIEEGRLHLFEYNVQSQEIVAKV